MGFMDAFWEAAMAVKPSAESAEERLRFPFCTPEGLIGELQDAGIVGAEALAIEVTTKFADFEDLWGPFTRGAGRAPAYYRGLEPDTQRAVRQQLRSMFPDETAIQFPARAWAVRARKQ